MDRPLMDRLLLALAAGDSLGSTSEFVPQRDIPALYERLRPSGWPFKQIGAGHFRWAPGAPTDDTDMALCLVRSAMKCGGFDGADVARRFVAWLDGAPRDAGRTTIETLSAVREGVAWDRGALANFAMQPGNAANGSLMRNGVVAGIGGDLREGWKISILHSLITHYAPLPVLCCAAQTYLTFRLLKDPSLLERRWQDDFVMEFADFVAKEADPGIEFWREQVREKWDPALEAFQATDFAPNSFNPFQVSFAGRAGYCLLTLQIAIWAAAWAARRTPFPTPAAFPAEPFARTGGWTLAWVAMIGHDSDTYGAAAGPLIEAATGGIPQELISNLQVASEIAQ